MTTYTRTHTHAPGNLCAGFLVRVPIPCPIITCFPILGTSFTTIYKNAGRGAKSAGLGGTWEICIVMELSELELAVLFLSTPKEKKKIMFAHVDPMSREPSSYNHTPHRHVLHQAQQTRSTQSHIKVIFSIPQLTG